jgi:hypothetical protein
MPITTRALVNFNMVKRRTRMREGGGCTYSVSSLIRLRHHSSGKDFVNFPVALTDVTGYTISYIQTHILICGIVYGEASRINEEPVDSIGF